MISLKDRMDAQFIFRGMDDPDKQLQFALKLKENGITAEEVSEWVGDDQQELGLRMALVSFDQESSGNLNDRRKREILNLLLAEDLSQLAGFHFLVINSAFHMFGKLTLRRMQKTLPEQYHQLVERAIAAFPASEERLLGLYQDYEQQTQG
ncbi:MAG: hypothetical protein Q4A67_00910 [Aerococcus sp.]|nr:hypothetical protein [Aerococcus sp.]